jgi:hypothetical protein
LHNRLWELELDQKVKTNRHLTTWLSSTKRTQFQGRTEGGGSRAEDRSREGNSTSGRRPKLRDRTQFRADAKTARPNPISGACENCATEPNSGACENCATEPNFGRRTKLRDRTQFRADTRPGWWQPVVISRRHFSIPNLGHQASNANSGRHEVSDFDERSHLP